jgi:GNAT superfamily N-acetyltransferase
VTIRIRRARRDDAGELTRVAHAAKRHWSYPEELIDLWEEDLTVAPAFIARQPVYCAVRGRTVIGFYAVSGTGRVRELEHMWVRPRHIGSGVGRALFAHLLGRLRAMRVTGLMVASDPHAEGFYRRMGAWRVGRVPARPRGRTLPLLLVRVPASAHSAATLDRLSPRRRPRL